MIKNGVLVAVFGGVNLFCSCGGMNSDTNEMEAEGAMTTDGSGKQGPVRDVCGFKETVSLVSLGDGEARIPPSHPEIRYGGRIDCGDPEALRIAHPGVSIRVRFRGAWIGMLFDDFGVEEYPNFYDIVVDDGPPTLLETSPNRRRYPLAERLDAGPHTVEIVKRGESCAAGTLNNGKGVFRGFVIPQEGAVLPLSPRPRRVEFIGDSITCGYGNELSTDTPEAYPYTSRGSNAAIAYGALVARALDAEYMAVAYSGRGIVRNFAGAPGKTVPEMYRDILPDDETPGVWDVSRYDPELVVVNLGTNDFSEGLSPEALSGLRDAYEWEYHRFLDTLRGAYPDTPIILGVGPVLNDDWPKGVAALTTVRTIVERIVTERRADGDSNLYALIHERQTAPFGEDWHPTAERHRIMADELLAFLETHGIF